MRGKLKEIWGEAGENRNIPAYAGKTAGENIKNRFNEEHPRVCGENLARSCPRARMRGTSPRMRGKRLFASSLALSNAEHPRVCGENKHDRPEVINLGGTSPRMRGKLPRSGSRKPWTGNIPAYAGKTTPQPAPD